MNLIYLISGSGVEGRGDGVLDLASCCCCCCCCCCCWTTFPDLFIRSSNKLTSFSESYNTKHHKIAL